MELNSGIENSELCVRVRQEEGGKYFGDVLAYFGGENGGTEFSGAVNLNFDFDLFQVLSLRQPSRVTSATDSDSTLFSRQYLGRRLYEGLFGGKLGELYERVWRSTVRAGLERRLRLRLVFPAGDRALKLPWELLYHGDSAFGSGDFVALSGVGIVRGIETLDSPMRFERLEQPLRMLIVAYGGKDIHVSVHQEVASIREPLHHVGIATVLMGPTIAELAQTLMSERPHIMHYIGTGVETADGVQAIILRDGEVLHQAMLRDLLFRTGGLRFLVLNGSDTDGLTADAARYLPAALGVLGAISDEGALLLTKRLYLELWRGVPLDQALASARREINLLRPGSLDWSAPVLYVKGDPLSLSLRAPPQPGPIASPGDAVEIPSLGVTRIGEDTEGEYLVARLEVDRRNIERLEAQARDVGDPVQTLLHAEIARLRKRIEETEAALRSRGT